MNIPFTEAFRIIVENIIGRSGNDERFLIVLGTAVVVMVLMGKVFSSSIGHEGRGFAVSFVGVVVPLVAGVCAVAGGMTFLPAMLQNIPLAWALSVSGGVAAGLLVAMLFSRPLLSVSMMEMFFIALLTYLFAYGSLYAAELGINVYDAGIKNVQEYRQN